MAASPRLSRRVLASLPAEIERPGYDIESVETGQVHLGVGAFMRAHAAVYTDAAIAAKGGPWGVAGVSLRQPTVRDQLRAQDCLYTVATHDNETTSRRLIAAIQSIDVAPDDPQRVIQLLADASVRVVTMTVTEKGYCLAPDSGMLDTENADIAHDINVSNAPRSMPGFLVAAMRARRKNNAGPLTVVACDNLPDNGARLQRGVLAFSDSVEPSLRAWIDANVRFPATMVDRIVP
ncbi:MAG: mannitol dehydrogenase family protein, partial [Gammaproteobacteria bacterium]|nr:mannitol dehydrogenase family protein [Gammaproteobacteria bacterium]